MIKIEVKLSTQSSELIANKNDSFSCLLLEALAKTKEG